MMRRRSYYATGYLAVCVALAIGEWCGFRLVAAAEYWPLAAYFTMVMALFAYGYARLMLWLLAVFTLGLTLALGSEVPRKRLLERTELDHGPFKAELQVEGGVCENGGWVSFDSTVDGVRMRVIYEDDGHGPLPQGGERWFCAGWIERKPMAWRGRRAVWVRGRGTCARRMAAAADGAWGRMLHALRRRLSEAAGFGLDHAPLAADLNRAILLGERQELPRSIRRLFADAGTAHIFAISGLHVTIIARFLVALAQGMMVPRRWVVFAFAPTLWLYVLMIGAPTSAVRAAAMATVYYSAPVFLRRSELLVAWAVTFVSFHLFRPAMLFEVGSLLSFAVTLGILLCANWVDDVELGSKAKPLTMSLVAWISGAAISACVFGQLSFGGLLANMAVLPLAFYSIVYGAIGAVTGLCCPFLAAHLNNASALVTQSLIGISWVTVQLPFNCRSVGPWSAWYCFAWYAVPLLTMWLIRSVILRRRRIL